MTVILFVYYLFYNKHLDVLFPYHLEAKEGWWRSRVYHFPQGTSCC